MIAKITILNDGSRNEATLTHSNNVKVRFAEDGVILNDLTVFLDLIGHRCVNGIHFGIGTADFKALNVRSW